MFGIIAKNNVGANASESALLIISPGLPARQPQASSRTPGARCASRLPLLRPRYRFVAWRRPYDGRPGSCSPRGNYSRLLR